MLRYISQYADTCDLYIRTKFIWHISLRELNTLTIPNTRWKTINIELSEFTIFNTMMIVVDFITKMTYFNLIYTTIIVILENIAKLFLHYV